LHSWKKFNLVDSKFNLVDSWHFMLNFELLLQGSQEEYARPTG
jgi:hypothetical protein